MVLFIFTIKTLQHECEQVECDADGTVSELKAALPARDGWRAAAQIQLCCSACCREQTTFAFLLDFALMFRRSLAAHLCRRQAAVRC